MSFGGPVGNLFKGSLRILLMNNRALLKSLLLLLICIAAFTHFIVDANHNRRGTFISRSLSQNLKQRRSWKPQQKQPLERNVGTQSRAKFLWYKSTDGGGIDAHCPGLMHQVASLTCAASEAVKLGRTLVLPSKICVNGIHNYGNTLIEPIETLIDLHVLDRCCKVVLETDPQFERAVARAEKSTRYITGFEVPFRDLLTDNSTIVVRHQWPLTPGNEPTWWFAACWDKVNGHSVLGKADIYSNDPFSECVQPHMTQVNAAREIVKLLGGYTSMHVRRGDKIWEDPTGFIANVTHPAALIHCLAPKLRRTSRIYMATSETDEAFFAALQAYYRIFTWRDFIPILEKYGVIFPNYSMPCLENKSNCKYNIPNNYHLFQIEHYIFKMSDEHVEVHDKFHGTDWWLSCAVQCAPYNCTAAPAVATARKALGRR